MDAVADPEPIEAPPEVADPPSVVESIEPLSIEVRDAARREIDIRLVPWDTAIDTMQGRELFRRGAFDGIDPSSVLLMGLEHEARIGLGQDGRPGLTRVPVGRGIAIDATVPRITFRVARTAHGDEVLALATDRIVTGASIEFEEMPGGSTSEVVSGRRTRIHNRVRLHGVSTTYRPAYGEGSTVLAVRVGAEGAGQMAEAIEEAAVVAAPVPAVPAIDQDALAAAIGASVGSQLAPVAERIGAMEERFRTQFTIPAPAAEPSIAALRGDWMHSVLNMLAGQPMSTIQNRIVADLITSDNIGVVPDAFLTEIIGIINPKRPFLGTTRRLDLPPNGMTLTVPKIVTRPTTGTQAEEKDELTSTPTSITQASFDAVTIGGYGDISLQLLRRSSPSYLNLYLELLAEALAANAEAAAVASLLAHYGTGGVQDGGFLDPEDLQLGGAWENAAAVNLQADTMWLSTASVSAFIDAKASTTNMPMYTQLQAGFSVPGGTGGTIAGLRPVWVPALDATSADVVVGPSRGFGWTEDGALTLQVDNPAKAGRDVALVTILWFAPMYESAFTGYTLSFS